LRLLFIYHLINILFAFSLLNPRLQSWYLIFDLHLLLFKVLLSLGILLTLPQLFIQLLKLLFVVFQFADTEGIHFFGWKIFFILSGSAPFAFFIIRWNWWLLWFGRVLIHCRLLMGFVKYFNSSCSSMRFRNELRG